MIGQKTPEKSCNARRTDFQRLSPRDLEPVALQMKWILHLLMSIHQPSFMNVRQRNRGILCPWDLWPSHPKNNESSGVDDKFVNQSAVKKKDQKVCWLTSGRPYGGKFHKYFFFFWNTIFFGKGGWTFDMKGEGVSRRGLTQKCRDCTFGYVWACYFLELNL